MRTVGRGSLSLQSLILAGSTALSQVLFALLSTIAARYAGPTAFGSTATALGIGGFLTGFIDWGFTSYSLRELAAGRMNQAEYWIRLRTKLLVGLLATGLLVAVGAAIHHPELGGMIALAMVSRTFLLGVSIPTRAAHRVGRAALVVLAEKGSWLAAFALLLATGLTTDPLAAFWWSMGIAMVVAGGVGLVTANGVLPFLAAGGLRRPWRSEAGYGTFSLALSLSMLDVALLSLAAGSAQAGVYGALCRWTQPILLLSQAYSAASTPFVAAASSSRAALRAVRRSFWIPGLGFATCLALVVLAPVAVPLLLGSAYRESAPALAILATAAAMVVVNQPLATFLQARGRARLVGRSTVASVALQLGGVWLLGTRLGAAGAALAYLLCQLLLLLTLVTGAALQVRRRLAPPEKAVSGTRA